MISKCRLDKIIGNNLSRDILSFISKRNGQSCPLEKVILSYNEEKLSLSDIPYYALIEILRRIVGLNKRSLREIAGNAFIRSGAILYAQSVAKFGITKPQKYTAPHHIIWNITDHCNIGTCGYCYQNSSPNKNCGEISLEKKIDLVGQFADMNVGYILFSGGEPLTSKHLFNVIEETVKKGIGVGIATNGVLLDEEIAKKFKEVGVRTINITLNGSRAEVHDKLIGKKGFWKKSIWAIKNSKKYGLRVETDSVISPINFSDLESLIDFSVDMGVDCIKLLPLIPAGRGKEIGQLSKKQIEFIIQIGQKYLNKGSYVLVGDPRYAIQLKEREGLIPYLAGLSGGCYAGRMYCAIQPNGVVVPCPVLPVEAGDTKKDSFSNIWENSKVFNELRDRTYLKGACSTCKDKEYCGGCRARAYGETRDYLAEDPACLFSKTKLVQL